MSNHMSFNCLKCVFTDLGWFYELSPLILTVLQILTMMRPHRQKNDTIASKNLIFHIRTQSIVAVIFSVKVVIRCLKCWVNLKNIILGHSSTTKFGLYKGLEASFFCNPFCGRKSTTHLWNSTLLARNLTLPNQKASRMTLKSSKALGHPYPMKMCGVIGFVLERGESP